MTAMNDSTNHTHEGLSDQIATLQRQNFILMLALVVVSGTLAAYLYYQSRVMEKTIENVKPQATQLIQTYKKVSASLNRPQIQTFLTQINAYAVAHPDFQPILKKYGWTPAAVTNSAPLK